MVLFGRGRNGTSALEEASRTARGNAADGSGARISRNGVCAGSFMGRKPYDKSGLPVLLVPRERGLSTAQGWLAGVEDGQVHGRAQTDRKESVGTVGRRNMVRSYAR